MPGLTSLLPSSRGGFTGLAQWAASRPLSNKHISECLSCVRRCLKHSGSFSDKNGFFCPLGALLGEVNNKQTFEYSGRDTCPGFKYWGVASWKK